MESNSRNVKCEEVDIALLKVSALNVRHDIDEIIQDNETSVDDLAQSILTQGLINPISARPVGDGQHFEVIAGQRRLAACKKLGWSKIMCTIVSASMSDNEAIVHSLVENFQRQDNSYCDKVHAFTRLLEDYCQNDVDKLCKLVGVKKQTALRYVQMKKLPADVLQTLDANTDGKRLTLTAAQSLITLPDYQRSTVGKILVGKSINEARVIVDVIRSRPEIQSVIDLKELANDVLDHHSLERAYEANLIEDRSWRSDNPWIHHPRDRGEWFEITDIQSAYKLLQMVFHHHRILILIVLLDYLCLLVCIG
jgi:ParB/RepB/Spo0J family partition protein